MQVKGAGVLNLCREFRRGRHRSCLPGMNNKLRVIPLMHEHQLQEKLSCFLSGITNKARARPWQSPVCCNSHRSIHPLCRRSQLGVAGARGSDDAKPRVIPQSPSPPNHSVHSSIIAPHAIDKLSAQRNRLQPVHAFPPCSPYLPRLLPITALVASPVPNRTDSSSHCLTPPEPLKPLHISPFIRTNNVRDRPPTAAIARVDPSGRRVLSPHFPHLPSALAHSALRPDATLDPRARRVRRDDRPDR